MSRKYEVNQGCTFCGTCVYECPSGAMGMGPEGAVIDTDRCTGCGVCFANCASEAISKADPGEFNQHGGES